MEISCHNLLITYFTLTFSSIDLYIAKKIYEQTNCENKSLRELPLFNLQIFLFRIWFQKYTKQCRSVQLIYPFHPSSTPIYIRTLSTIYYHIFRCNMLIFACPIIAKSQCWLFALRSKFLFSTTYIFELIIPFQVI
jgi:hypothetical protein